MARIKNAKIENKSLRRFLMIVLTPVIIVLIIIENIFTEVSRAYRSLYIVQSIRSDFEKFYEIYKKEFFN